MEFIKNFLLSLFTTSMATSIVILIIFLILNAFKNNISPKTRYVIWIILLISLCIPFRPIITEIMFLFKEPTIITQGTLGLPAPVTQYGTNVTENIAQVATTNSHVSLIDYVKNISISSILFTIWLIGFIFVSIKQFINYKNFRKVVARFGNTIKDGHIFEIFQNIKKKLNIDNDNIKLMYLPAVHSPMMTGFKNPTIILNDLDLHPDEISLIIEHELTHYMHNDIYINTLGIVTNSVHWFNPFVKLCTRETQEAGELYCDYTVLKNKNEDYRKFYGEIIISMIERSGMKQIALTTCFYSTKFNLRRRIVSIMKNTNKYAKKKTIIIGLVTAALITLSGSIIGFSNSANAVLNNDKAKEIALSDARLNSNEVTFVKVKKSFENGREVFDVEFYKDNIEFDYVIDAKTGEIIGKDYELENFSNPNKTSNSSTSNIALNEDTAKATALADSGLSAGDVEFLSVRIEYDNGRPVYKVEFYKGNQEYDYKIDAATGQIIEKDYDVENYSTNNTAVNVAPATSDNSASVSPSATTSNVYPNVPPGAKVEYDYENGRAVYEVEYKNGNTEYKYVYDANTGALIESEIDVDDDWDD